MGEGNGARKVQRAETSLRSFSSPDLLQSSFWYFFLLLPQQMGQSLTSKMKSCLLKGTNTGLLFSISHLNSPTFICETQQNKRWYTFG
jgi:hypothetical protein